VEKEHQCAGLTFFGVLVMVYAVMIGYNYSEVVQSRRTPPTSVSAGPEPDWHLPNMVGGREGR
jgi:hypothetical protein